jgi:hypothetical protein
MNPVTQRGRAPGRALTAALALATASTAGGLTACKTIDIQFAPHGILEGRVNAAKDDGDPVVIVALDGRNGKMVHRAFLESQRSYSMRVPAGSYKLFAFADHDRNGRLDDGEMSSVLYALATPVRAYDRIELPTIEIRARRALAGLSGPQR